MEPQAVAKKEKDSAKAIREQEMHDTEIWTQRISSLSEKAYTLRSCIMMAEVEDSEDWKASRKAQWTSEQLEGLMSRLYETLMDL